MDSTGLRLGSTGLKWSQLGSDLAQTGLNRSHLGSTNWAFYEDEMMNMKKSLFSKRISLRALKYKKSKGPLLIFNFWSIDGGAALVVQSLFVGV